MGDADSAWKTADALGSAVTALDAPLLPTEVGRIDAPIPAPTSNMSKTAFDMVRRAKDTAGYLSGGALAAFHYPV